MVDADADVQWKGPDALRDLLVPVASLDLDPGNVMTHPERSLEAIRASFRRFGQQFPVVIDENGTVRDGNGRLAAARALGWSHVAVVRSDLGGSELVAYALAANRTAQHGEWDDDALAAVLKALADEGAGITDLGWSAEEMAGLIAGAVPEEDEGGAAAEDPGAQIDRAEELQAKWRTEPGQLWIIPSKTVAGKEHRLLCGDSTKPEDVARLMDGDKALLVATDPPYGVDFKRGQYISDKSRVGKSSAPSEILGDSRKGEDQQAFVGAVFKTMKPHVVPGCSVYMFSAVLNEGCHSYFGMLDAGVRIQSQLIWNKNNHTLGQADYHWKHEVCWYGWYDNGSHRWYGGRDKFTVIDCARVQATLHPNEKPVAIIEDFLDNSSLPGDIVAEPFSGGGTTLAACESKGRACRAMELDPKFVAVALERLSGLGLEPRLSDSPSLDR